LDAVTGPYPSYEVRMRAVDAVQRGVGVCVVADAFGIDRTTVFRWVRRYQADRTGGLQRKLGSGRPRILELGGITESDLRKLIVEPASRYGYETDLWTVGRVQTALQEAFQINISKDTVWRRLREAGLTYQKRRWCRKAL